MTSDFDELASAYLDGQATDAQAARVDSDPQLLARVAELRSLSETMNVDVPPPDDFLKRRQIGAALDAFDASHRQQSAAEGATPSASEPVDLSGRRANRDSRATGPGGLPRWLSVAAVLLLVVGGVGLLTQIEGSDDSDEATAADSAELETVEADGEEASEALTDSTTVAAREEADAGAPAAGSAEGGDAEQTFAADGDDEAASDDSGDEESEEQAAEDSDESEASTTTVTALPSTSAGGFFPEEELEAARVSLQGSPSETELLALADGARFDPALAGCAAEIEAANDLEVRFFVPVSVDGVDGEALFGGSEIDPVVVVVDGECAPLG